MKERGIRNRAYFHPHGLTFSLKAGSKVWLGISTSGGCANTRREERTKSRLGSTLTMMHGLASPGEGRRQWAHARTYGSGQAQERRRWLGHRHRARRFEALQELAPLPLLRLHPRPTAWHGIAQ